MTAHVRMSLAMGYRGFVARRLVVLATATVVLLLVFVADVLTGPSVFSARNVLIGVLHPDALDLGHRVILWNVRLPAAVMAILVGASLGLAGAEMQTVLNNPLSSPFTLGVSASATFGAALVIVYDIRLFGLGPGATTAAMAFSFAAASILLINALSQAYGSASETILLFGVALVFVMNAAVALLQFVSTADAVQQIVFWTLGNLGRADWSNIPIVFAVLLVCLPLSLHSAWSMTAMRAGDEHARSLGIPVELLRLLALLRVSLLAGVAVAFVGTIGFVGLVGPHMARLLLGEDHRFLLPGAALAGALLLSMASIASKAMIPGVVLPAGIVTSLVGVPLFMAILFVQRVR